MTSPFLRSILALLCFISVTHAQKNAAPRSGTIAYVRGSTEVRLINADGTDDRRLWTHPDAKKELGIYGVAWRPDGKEGVISSGHAAAYSLYHSDLYAIRPDGTGFRKVTNSPDRAEFAKYPKGSVSVTLRNDQPLYRQSQASAGVFIVYIAGADEPQQITLPPGATKTILFKNVADFGNMAQAVVAIWGKYRWFTTGVDVHAAQTLKALVFSISGEGIDLLGAFRPVWKMDGSRVSYRSGGRYPDDERQIKRWRAMRRHIAQIKKHCPTAEAECRPRQRQALLHWAYDSREI